MTCHPLMSQTKVRKLERTSSKAVALRSRVGGQSIQTWSPSAGLAPAASTTCPGPPSPGPENCDCLGPDFGAASPLKAWCLFSTLSSDARFEFVPFHFRILFNSTALTNSRAVSLTVSENGTSLGPDCRCRLATGCIAVVHYIASRHLSTALLGHRVLPYLRPVGASPTFAR